MLPFRFPELNTHRIRLRAIEFYDTTKIYALYADARVMEQRGAPVHHRSDQAHELIFYWNQLLGNENGIRWGIEWKENQELIGTIGFKQIQQAHLRAEIGYELSPEYWNKGIMTEAGLAVLDYAFNELNLHSIEANISPDHIASQRVLEKWGFVQEALYRENYFYERWWDSAIYSKVRA
jgi:[ribosomal protein S5]-alanine N-acetyltransferase